MSQENVEIVRRGFQAFKARDTATMLDSFSPTIEWRTAEDEPDPQTYRGFDGVLALISDWSQLWQEDFIDAAEPQEFIDAGDFVVVPVRAVVRGKGSGVEVEILETYSCRVAGGKVVEVQEYR